MEEREGLTPSGRLSQGIHDDPFDLDGWETEHRCRYFVNIANSLVWRTIIGFGFPAVRLTAKEYT